MTRAIEILHISKNHVSNSHWSDVYITIGFNILDQSQSDITVASVPALLQNHTFASNGLIWEKLPNLPHPLRSINEYHIWRCSFG